MKIPPKEVMLNLPIVLTFESEDEAPKFAANINTLIHGKSHLKYDILGLLDRKVVVIFYLQRTGEYHSLRNSFMQLIEQEEMLTANAENTIAENLDELSIKEKGILWG